MPKYYTKRLSVQEDITEVKKSREGEGSLFLYAVSGSQGFYAANKLLGEITIDQ